MDNKEFEKLQNQRLKLIFELGEKASFLLRTGKISNEILWEYVEKLKGVDKEIYTAKENKIPSKEDKVCPECGAEIVEASNFCVDCGFNVTEFYEDKIVKCEDCGFLIEKSFAFCSVCGVKRGE